MLKDLIKKEQLRQRRVINLIASENYVSDGVKAALGSDLTNKYAEGQAGARYYAGNEVVDKIELEVKRLAQAVFRTDYSVNVQAYSGSIANLAVYFAFLKPGETFMGLELSHGGHLTHGHPVTYTGKLFHRVSYFLDPKTEQIDYQALAKLAQEHKPKLIISGASAYSRKIDFSQISAIARKVEAIHLADVSHIAGLIAVGLHPTPFGNADIIMTTTHKTLCGPRAALLFSKPEYAKLIDRSVFPGLQGGPHLNTIAAIGVCLEEARKPEFKEYSQRVIDNARALAQALQQEGVRVVSGGTDNHSFLVDLRPLGLSGQEAQERLEKEDIIVNKNAIPFDDSPPQNPAGIRLGTPAITTQGMKPAEMTELARRIAEILKV